MLSTSTATGSLPRPASVSLETIRVWSLHLLCFVLPLTCLAFTQTAPHPWWASIPWFGVVVASVFGDVYSSKERRQPAELMPDWPFTGVLLALTGMQLVNVYLFVKMVGANGFWRMDTLIGLLLQGITSGYSGIVVAHELIHRKERWLHQLGRVLLGAVLYEHFATEHIRGHHVRVGTAADPATARFGETRVEHFRRNVPDQLKSAWKLETTRLGDAAMGLFDPRQLGNRVLHGLVAEWGVAFTVAATLGLGAFVAYVLQAYIAIVLLECVNFFEHWGLTRSDRRVQPMDSWDTSSWFTLYTLVGLSRHADHHAYSTRPYQQLRYFEESPKLPSGYFGMVVLALFAPERYEQLMTDHLRRRKLGPFAESAEAGVDPSTIASVASAAMPLAAAPAAV